MKTLLVLALFSTTTLAADPTLLSAVSRKTHGAQTFDIQLSEAVDTIEPRSGTHVIVFTWDKPVFGAECYLTEGTATLDWAFAYGNTAICVYRTTVNQWVGVQAVVEAYDSTLGDATVRVGHLLGDVNGSGAVTVADYAKTRPQIAQALTAANFRYDVNASGAITVSDAAIVQSRIATGLPRD